MKKGNRNALILIAILLAIMIIVIWICWSFAINPKVAGVIAGIVGSVAAIYIATNRQHFSDQDAEE